MGDENQPAEISGWPKLVITYRTDPDKVAALLPPGIEPGAEPIVTIGGYCVPILNEPEYGTSTRVRADFDGIAGDFSLGIGIDQEAAIFNSKEINGQPKFPCATRYFRFGEAVEATATHQGYTFFEFRGRSTGSIDPEPGDSEHNEWWLKYSRAVGGAEGEWDYPPHVVRVRQVSEEVHVEELDGTLTLRDSPWDPHTELLPMREQISARLITSVHKAREITNAGPLDPVAFWPHADTIGGSRWPGHRGGPHNLR